MILRSCARQLNGVVRIGPEISPKRSYSIAVAARKSRQWTAHHHLGRSGQHYHAQVNVTYDSQRTFISSWFSQPKASQDPLTKEPILADAPQAPQATQATSISLSQSSQLSPALPSTPTPISSTASSSPPPQFSPSTPSTSGTSLDELINPEQLESLNVGHVVEEIGFLKNLGLDFGWGPTAVMQWLLEHIHIYAGTPWWTSIILSAFLVRASLIKMFFKSADVAARQRALMPVLQPLQDKVKVAKANGDRDGYSQASQEIKQVFKTAGFNPISILLPGTVQAVLGYGTFRLLRNMSTLPVPGLKDGGTAWFNDLTLPDPYYILPAVAAVGMHMLFRIGGETGNHNLQTRYRELMLYGFPALGFVFMIWQPSALQVSFAAASLLALVQSRLLKNATLRRWLGITPLYEMESSNAAAVVAAAQESVIGDKAPAAAAAIKKNNPSSVKNIVTRPQYQPPPRRSILKGRGRQAVAASSSSANASDVVAAGRTFSSSPSSPASASLANTPFQPKEEAKEKRKETWLFRTIIAARDSFSDSVRSVKKVAGLGGPPPDSENTTTNAVKTRGYLKDAEVYEAERQQYFRDMRVRRRREEEKMNEMKEKEVLERGGKGKGKSEMWT